MITELEVENFKAFGARQRARLARITLIYGGNSSGKSTLICSISKCDLSEVAQDARQKARRPIPDGMNPLQLWEERFSKLVSICTQSAIVMDRYGFQNTDGLRFVLDRLTRDLSQTVSVQVYGAVDSHDVLARFKELEHEFEDRWANRIGKLSFFPREGGFFGRVRHDRYIRLDRTVCWTKSACGG